MTQDFRGQSGTRDSAIVLANCQGPPIAWVMGQIPALGALYDFKWFPNYGIDGPLSSVPEEILARCRLIFYQVGELALSANEMALLPDDCRIVRFGAPATNALFPRQGHWPLDREGRPRSTLNPALADKLAVHLIGLGHDRNTYVEEYFRHQIATETRVERLHALDLARLERGDREGDIQIADYVAENVRLDRLFHTPLHPTNKLYFCLMGRMFDFCRAAEVPGFEDPAGLRVGLKLVEENGPAAFGAHEFFGEVQTPVHPEVIDILDLKFCTPETIYENKGVGRWTHYEYINFLYDCMNAA